MVTCRQRCRFDCPGTKKRNEHYEIAAYGTVGTYAEQLNECEAKQTLNETSDEEKDTDDTLSIVAVSVNAKAHITTT